MSYAVNKAILIGNLGDDPELKFTSGNKGVLKFSIATTESWMDDGEKKEVTFWHRVVVWGKRGEALEKFLRKGSRVYVEGRIETRSYDDKDGVKKYATDINAKEIVLLDGKRDSDERGRDRDDDRGSKRDDDRGSRRDDRNERDHRGSERPRSSSNGNAGAKASDRKREQPADDFGRGGDSDDDIPF